jgi:hypothetical protein
MYLEFLCWFNLSCLNEIVSCIYPLSRRILDKNLLNFNYLDIILLVSIRLSCYLVDCFSFFGKKNLLNNFIALSLKDLFISRVLPFFVSAMILFSWLIYLSPRNLRGFNHFPSYLTQSDFSGWRIIPLFTSSSILKGWLAANNQSSA